MRRTTLIVSSIVALLSSPTLASAQAGLREGLKVRVSVGGPAMTGQIQSVTPDSLFLFAEPAGTRVGIARQSIQSLKVSHGKSATQGAKKGATWGAIIGGGFGLLFAATLEKDSPELKDTGLSPTEFGFVALVEGIGIGAGIGALIKSEKWETVAVQPTIASGKSGLRVELSIR